MKYQIYHQKYDFLCFVEGIGYLGRITITSIHYYVVLVLLYYITYAAMVNVCLMSYLLFIPKQNKRYVM